MGRIDPVECIGVSQQRNGNVLNVKPPAIDRPNLSYIRGMKKIVSIISNLCPLIIVNESKIGFITSDVPVVKYNQWFLERGYRHPFGFGHMGCQCFVPLSAKICFCLYDDIYTKINLEIKEELDCMMKKMWKN